MGYWSVDIPGLSQDEAAQILALAAARSLGQGGSLVDPAAFLTLHLDRETVVALHTAVSRASAAAEASDRDQDRDPITTGVAEILGDWLQGPR